MGNSESHSDDLTDYNSDAFDDVESVDESDVNQSPIGRKEEEPEDTMSEGAKRTDSAVAAIMPSRRIKIAIIGAGHVGAATANALLYSRRVREIVLLDLDGKKAEAEAMDLRHAAAAADPHVMDVYAGEWADIEGSAVVIITAGHAERPDETQQTLMRANYETLRMIVPRIAKHAPDAVLLVASHPVEAMTYAAFKLSGFPAPRVIGSGTALDTARFRAELAKFYEVSPLDVNVVVAGQHGTEEVSEWSSITINGLPLQSYCEQTGREYSNEELFACFLKARQAGYEILERKGSPTYSMAAGLASIVKAIVDDENLIMTVSVVGDFFGVQGIALSVPARIGRGGAKAMPGWSNDWREEEQLKDGALKVQESILELAF